ncbi:MAG: hypothetical protein HRT73_15105, partial [Flavobacteriales bacterium]|nr:hypothetical protein [Flavobacteriales bacterium]
QGNYFDIKISCLNGFAKSSDNKDITLCLVNPYVINFQHSELLTITFATKYLIKGIKVPSIKDFRMQNTFIKFNLFDQWVGKYGFDVSPSYNPKKFNVKIDFTPPDNIELYSNNKFKMYVHFRAKSPMFNHKPELILKQSAFFNIEFNQKQKLENVKDLVDKIQDFFSFASGIPVRISQFEFRNHSNNVAKKRKLSNPTGILIDKSKSIKKVESRSHHNFLIHFSDLEKTNKNVIEEWLNKYEVLSPVIKMFLENSYHPNLFLETEFLNYIQAIEVYHNRAINGKQIKLRTRLDELLTKHSKLMSKIIPYKSTFTNRVVKTRNYLTHYNPKIKKRDILKHQSMYDTSMRLKILLQVVILDELGFERPFIIDKIKSTNEWTHMIANMNK